jgi:hypothetical protein
MLHSHSAPSARLRGAGFVAAARGQGDFVQGQPADVIRFGSLGFVPSCPDSPCWRAGANAPLVRSQSPTPVNRGFVIGSLTV